MSATRLGQGPKTLRECQGLTARNVVGHSDPRKDPLTLAVCLAVAAGYRWAAPKPYLDTTEEVDGKLIRSVSWCFDAESRVLFDGREVTFSEFWKVVYEGDAAELVSLRVMRRVYSDAVRVLSAGEWADELRSRGFEDAGRIFYEFRLSPPPRFALFRGVRGKQEIRCYIPMNATAEEQAKLLADAGL